jgi:hypothetical protein
MLKSYIKKVGRASPAMREGEEERRRRSGEAIS